jgi:diguanylate cyclase (GGDEF)-like protein
MRRAGSGGAESAAGWGPGAGIPARRTSDRVAARFASEYLDAIRAADGAEAERIALEALRSGLAAAAVLNRVIAAAMREIGALWERGAIGVADEHAATALTHRVLAAVYAQALPDSPRHEGSILLAAIAGQRHGLGVRMAADVLEIAGYRVINLAADVPTDSLLEAIWHRRPHLVGLSATLADGVETVEDVIAAVREIAPRMPIVVGGAAAPPDLADESIRSVADLEQLPPTVAGLLGDRPRRPRISRPPSAAAAAATAARADPEWSAAESTEQVAELVREKAREALEYRSLAFSDPLSGLPNRRALDDRFNALLATGGAGSAGALVLIDVDRFKQVNDELGHAVGDRVLAELADVLERESREADFPARLGGDEFALLLPGSDAESAVRSGQRLRRKLAKRLTDPPVTVSLGIAEIRNGKRATMIAADQALYRAKAAGRNAIEVAE